MQDDAPSWATNPMEHGEHEEAELDPAAGFEVPGGQSVHVEPQLAGHW